MIGPNLIYLSTDGLLDPLGQSQILSYLERLAASHRITLITAEKDHRTADLKLREETADALRKKNISWIPLKYILTGPLGVRLLILLVFLSVSALYNAIKLRPVTLHCRSYLAGLVGLLVKVTTGANFVYDTRGLWIEEKIEQGVLKKGSLLHKALVYIELLLLRRSSAVIVLTERARRHLRRISGISDDKIRRIPTCYDPKYVEAQPSERARIYLTLGYVGSIGCSYDFKRYVELVGELNRREGCVRGLVVSETSIDSIVEIVESTGVDNSLFTIERAHQREIGAFYRRMDLLCAFYKKGDARIGTLPTKIPESLAHGVPIAVSDGVGDFNEIIRNSRIGILIREEVPLGDYYRDIIELINYSNLSAICMNYAVKNYNIDYYVNILKDLYEVN